MRSLICEVMKDFKPVNVDCDGNVIPMPKPEKKLLTIEGGEVPAEKLKAMQDYARILIKKFPRMKPARIQRKVAEHFKIKLV